jgi:hypothetical protein
MADVLLVADERTGPAGVSYVLVQVEWDGLAVDRPVVRVMASYTGGDAVDVAYVLRGSTEVHPGDGTVRTYVDPQVPFGRTVTYHVEWASSVAVGDWTASAWDGASVAAAVAIPEMGLVHVLSDPGNVVGSVSLPQMPNGLPRASEQPGSVVRVQGRATPVPLWDARSSESGSVDLLCRTPAQAAGLSALLASGAPVLSRHGNTSLSFQPEREFWHVGGVSRTRRGFDVAAVTVEFTVVDDPDPDVLATVGTLADMDAAFDQGIATDPTFSQIATYLTGLGLDTFADVAAYDWWTEAQ